MFVDDQKLGILSAMKKQFCLFAAFSVVIALAACGGKASKPDPAYFGTWRWAHGDDVERVTISTDTLRFWQNYMRREYILAALTWEPIDEPDHYDNFPTGYIITGTLIASHNISVTSGVDSPHGDSDGEAAPGELVQRVWYINKGGQALTPGILPHPHGVTHDVLLYIKQPDAPATATVADYDPAFFGTWKTDPNATEGMWWQVTISADALVFLDDAGYGYTLTGLTWEPAAHEVNDDIGYKITGILETADGYGLFAPDGESEARVGECASDVWYLGEYGTYLTSGDRDGYVRRYPRGEFTVSPYDKQAPVEEVEQIGQEGWEALLIPDDERYPVWNQEKADAGEYHRITKDEIEKYALERLPGKREGLLSDYVGTVSDNDFWEGCRGWFVTDTIGILNGVKSLVIVWSNGHRSSGWLVNYNETSGDYIDSFPIHCYYEGDYGLSITNATINRQFEFIELSESVPDTFKDYDSGERETWKIVTRMKVCVQEPGHFRVTSRFSKLSEPLTEFERWEEAEEVNENN